MAQGYAQAGLSNIETIARQHLRTLDPDKQVYSLQRMQALRYYGLTAEQAVAIETGKATLKAS